MNHAPRLALAVCLLAILALGWPAAASADLSAGGGGGSSVTLPAPYTTTSTTSSTSDTPCTPTGGAPELLSNGQLAQPCTLTRTTRTTTVATLHTPVPTYTDEIVGYTTGVTGYTTGIVGYTTEITGYTEKLTGYKTVAYGPYYKTLYHWVTTTKKVRNGGHWVQVPVPQPTGPKHSVWTWEWVWYYKTITTTTQVPYTITYYITTQVPQYTKEPVYGQVSVYGQVPVYGQIPVYGEVMTGYYWTTSSHTSISTSRQTLSAWLPVTQQTTTSPWGCGPGYCNGIYVEPIPYWGPQP